MSLTPYQSALDFEISSSLNLFMNLIFELDFLPISNWILQAKQGVKIKFEIEKKSIP